MSLIPAATVILVTCCLSLISSGGSLAAQDRDEQTAATIRGKIVPAENAPFVFDLTSLEVMIAEQMAYKPLPLPPDWGTRTAEQRQAWIKEFQETTEGKEFFTKREEYFKSQRRFPLQIESEGSFEVFDVPAASYNLFGRKDVEVDGKKYAVEVFGQFEVGEVDEMALQPLPLTITRLLSSGETAPAFEVDSLTVDGQKLKLAQFQSRPVLVIFWTAGNPVAERDGPTWKKLYETLGPELQLELLTICVDEDSVKAKELLSAQQWSWPQGATRGWKHAVFTDYGLRAIPAFFLIRGDGTIACSNSEFFDEFSSGATDLVEIVRKKLAAPSTDVKQE